MSAQAGADPRGGKGFQPPAKSKRLTGHRAKILLGQRHDPLIVADGGQHIDKAKQLRLKVEIVHGQIDGRLRPPPALKQGWGLASGETGKLFTDATDRGFEVVDDSHETPSLIRKGRLCPLVSIHLRLPGQFYADKEFLD
jgi:hypothetical protein